MSRKETYRELRRRVKKIGQPPGTPVYTGNKKNPTLIRIINFSENDLIDISGENIDDLLEKAKPNDTEVIQWVIVEGLSNVETIEKLAKYYNLHPLTVEDILNVSQRIKAEEFDDYLFVSLKSLFWKKTKHNFFSEQMSIVLRDKVVLTFQEKNNSIINTIIEKLHKNNQQRLRQHGADYLTYRIIDAIVDQYFLILEKIGETIERNEDKIIDNPSPQRAKAIFYLKRRMLALRKTVWPLREIISRLLQAEGDYITSFTHTYLRDVYDHIVQAIDAIETLRDILSNMLDVYISTLTNRMNEIMKILTIISTIFIPLTFIASIYGMNFQYIPELHWHYGYPMILSIMGIVALIMLYYFKRKKWL